MINLVQLIDTANPTCTYIGADAGYNALKPTCCEPSVEGKSYCAEHVWLVYQKGSASGRRRKDAARAAAVWDVESAFNEAVEELMAEGMDF